MIQQITPFLKEIVTKILNDESTIYSCVPKRGVKVGPSGYWAAENEAIIAFYDELVKKGYITPTP